MDRDQYNDDDYRPPWMGNRHDYDDDYQQSLYTDDKSLHDREMKRDLSYSFCGVRGYVGDELAFSVVGGSCSVTLRRTVDTMAVYTLESQVSMVGTLYLEGLSGGGGSGLQAQDSLLLELSLMDVLSAESMVQIVKTTYTDPAAAVAAAAAVQVPPPSSSRMLTTEELVSNYVKQLLARSSSSSSVGSSWSSSDSTAWVTFDLEVVAEDFGVDGSSKSNIDSLVAQIASEIQTHIDNNRFKIRISHNSNNLRDHDGSSLLELSKEELLDLQFTSVTYAQVLPGSTTKGRETAVARDLLFGSLVGAVVGAAVLLAVAVFYLTVFKKRYFMTISKTERVEVEVSPHY